MKKYKVDKFEESDTLWLNPNTGMNKSETT